MINAIVNSPGWIGLSTTIPERIHAASIVYQPLFYFFRGIDEAMGSALYSVADNFKAESFAADQWQRKGKRIP